MRCNKILQIFNILSILLVLSIIETNAFHFNRFKKNQSSMRIYHNSKKRNNELVKIFDEIDYKREVVDNNGNPEDDELYPLVKAAILAGNARKAAGITALRVSHLTEVARYMIIMEGTSRPQNQAIVNSIEDDLEPLSSYRPQKQGDNSGGWILLDYGSLIIHVMTPQMRNFYKLEKRWKDAQLVDAASIIGAEEQLIESKVRDEVSAEYSLFDSDDDNDGDKVVEDDDEEEEERTIEPDENDPFWK